MSDPLDLTQKPTILVVDDTPHNLSLMSGLLKELYKIKVANNGEKAIRIVQSDSPPDLILLDIMMPGLSGYEVCKILKEDPRSRSIPIIFLTAMTAMEDEKKGLALGAVDFITKPVNPPIVMARVATHLQVKAAADFLRDQNAYLEKEVARRTQELAAIQDVTILAMASLAETRDTDTGNHIRRTQYYLQLLANFLKEHDRFRGFLSDHTITMLFKSAPLHDIGKVGIPDRILIKPGSFEPHEFEIMKTHCKLGRDAIQHAEDQLGLEVEFLKYAKEIAYCHQEKWDGTGYPEGLAGDAIPISARLMALADVYDALISRRIYKECMSHEQAVHIIGEGKGTHFDPDIVDAFLALTDQFQAIAKRYADSDSDLAMKAQTLKVITG